MGKLADRIASYVQDAIAKQIVSTNIQTGVGTVITSPSQVTTDALTVIFDGSALAVPVKQVRGLPLVSGARVVLAKFGGDWVVVGGLTNPGIGTGTSRIVIGADVPAELKAYGIDTATLIYLNDKVTNQEVGYFFTGSSNRFDGSGDSRVMAFGNVTYPTLGNPSSATMSDVKTNMQFDMWGQYRDTLFKDHRVVLWTSMDWETQNGFTRTRMMDGSGNLVAQMDANGIQGGQPATANVETWHAATLQNTWANFGAPFVTAQYRALASPAKSIEIIGTISGGTSANGTVLFNLPAGYRPLRQQRNACYAFGGTLNIATETPALDVATGGNVTCLACVNATIITFHFTVSLDA